MRDISTLLKATGRYYRGLAVLVLNALVILAGLELTSRVVLAVRSYLPRQETLPDPRAASSYYATEGWAHQYWREFLQSRKTQYHAYTVWRRAPFKGKTINIDERGIRVTPGSDCGPSSLKVFTFGGSQMWGTGSPDWSTIPAFLRTDFHENTGRPVCILNFGESGYASTQSVIELIQQLQSGNIPDIAIFTDGTGDIYSGYQSGKSGVHENLSIIAAKLEGQGQTRMGGILGSLTLYELISDQVQRFSAPRTQMFLTYESAGIQADKLSKAIGQTYLGNYEIVRSIAQKFGFDYFFFWPPYISVGKKVLTDEEKTLLRGLDPSLVKLSNSVYESMEPLIPTYDNFYSLTDVFDSQQSLIWLDDAHVTPVGNSVIAERIGQVIKTQSKRLLSSSILKVTELGTHKR